MVNLQSVGLPLAIGKYDPPALVIEGNTAKVAYRRMNDDDRKIK
jgi:hypothetical protein